jgi:hypothetical protein
VHQSGRRLSSGERATMPQPPLCPRRRRSMVDRARPGGPRRHGPGLRVYPLKNKSRPKFPCHFAKKPLCFSKINPRSSFADFAKKPLYFSKINPQSVIFQLSMKFKKYLQKVPSLRKIHKNSSKTPKIHIFSTTTPNPVILMPKFLESLPLSFYAFI